MMNLSIRAGIAWNLPTCLPFALCDLEGLGRSKSLALQLPRQSQQPDAAVSGVPGKMMCIHGGWLGVCWLLWLFARCGGEGVAVMTLVPHQMFAIQRFRPKSHQL